ncbi:MAG TPA: hypothetical protein VGJ77_00125 [Gaiellaceae bacterium]
MSFLRRILGGGDDRDERADERERPRRAHDEGSGPVYGHGEEPLSRSKPELLSLLRERGARSALIAYDGGNDEGGVSGISYSAEPLGAEPAEWTADALPTATEVDVESAFEDWEGPQGRFLQAAEAVICDKWGSFAGEFEVTGRLVVDVDSGRMARIDDVAVEDYPPEREVEVI